MSAAVMGELEKQIKQKKFENEWHKLRVNVLYSGGWLKGQISNFLEAYDITHQQFNILRILRGQHPGAISTMQIRDRMIDKMSDTSRIVDRLQRKGLLDKKACCGDRRLVDVTITQEGLKLLKDIDDKMYIMNEALNANLSQSEAVQLNSLLNKMRGAEN